MNQRVNFGRLIVACDHDGSAFGGLQVFGNRLHEFIPAATAAAQR